MPFSDDEIAAAVRDFWTGRATETQSAKHDKAFLKLIADELTSLGWPAHIALSFSDKEAVVSGHFRVAKSWDIVCRDTENIPRICVEFKSQVDSYGNNENNRYEEALGSGLDVRAKHGSETVLGFVFVVCDEPATRSITRARLPDLDPAFANSSHIDRRRVFSERIVEYMLNGESLYDAAALLLVRRDGTFEHPDNPDLWLVNFPDKLARAANERAKRRRDSQ
jgi:Restriction endonuclease XhoI